MRRPVVPLVVIALCSCGAGESEREVWERVDASTQQSCREIFPEPSAQRDCVERLRRETNAVRARVNASVDGARTTEGVNDQRQPTADSPVEWLLMRPVPSVLAYIATALVLAYCVGPLLAYWVGTLLAAVPRDRRTSRRRGR